MEKKEFGERFRKLREEKYQVPLFAAFLILVLEFMIPEGRRRKGEEE